MSIKAFESQIKCFVKKGKCGCLSRTQRNLGKSIGSLSPLIEIGLQVEGFKEEDYYLYKPSHENRIEISFNGFIYGYEQLVLL